MQINDCQNRPAGITVAAITDNYSIISLLQENRFERYTQESGEFFLQKYLDEHETTFIIPFTFCYFSNTKVRIVITSCYIRKTITNCEFLFTTLFFVLSFSQEISVKSPEITNKFVSKGQLTTYDKSK